MVHPPPPELHGQVQLRAGGIKEPLLEVLVIFSNQHHTNFVFNSISLILVPFFNEKRWNWNFF